jgi:hypothetical protein
MNGQLELVGSGSRRRWCTDEESDLSSSDSDVSRGDVGEGSNVSGELLHEGVAELSDLVVGSALGVKVASSLSSSDRQSSQGVLEDLLEPEAEGSKQARCILYQLQVGELGQVRR